MWAWSDTLKGRCAPGAATSSPLSLRPQHPPQLRNIGSGDQTPVGPDSPCSLDIRPVSADTQVRAGPLFSIYRNCSILARAFPLSHPRPCPNHLLGDALE